MDYPGGAELVGTRKPPRPNIRRNGTRSFTSAQGSIPMTLVDLKRRWAILAYNLTRVMNIVGIKPLLVAIRA